MVLSQLSQEHALSAETDELLHDIRNNAANALAHLSRCEKQSDRPKAVVLHCSSPSEIREQRKLAAKEKEEQEMMKSASETIILAHEKIVEENALLRQRLAAYRQHLNAKLQNYVKGVRSGALPDYIPDLSSLPEEEAAFNLYLSQHVRLDEAIRITAEQTEMNRYLVKGVA
jgi:phosphatidate phosphatase PAH1